MLIEILPGRRLKIADVQPAAQILAELLTIPGSLELQLGQPDADGMVTLPVPAPAPHTDVCGIELHLVRARVRIQAPIEVEIDVRLELPTPFDGASFDGRILAEEDGLALELVAGAGGIDLELAQGVSLVAPAGASARAEIAPGASSLAFEAAVGLANAPTLRMPHGQARLRALLIDDDEIKLRVAAALEVGGALAVAVEDLEVRVQSNQVELTARSRSRAAATTDRLRAELEAQHLAAKLAQGRVESIDASDGVITVTAAPLGQMRAAGSFGYRRSEPLPEDPATSGERWEFSLQALELPGALGGFVPRGTARLRLWPQHDTFVLDTTLTGTLPFLGEIGPVAASVEKLRETLTLTLSGLVLPSLELAPDLPALRLGPLDLELVLGRVIEGVVADEVDGPLANVDVELRDRDGVALPPRARTDAEGRFEFHPAPPDAHHVAIAGRRITEVRGALRGDLLWTVTEFHAAAAAPLTIPAGFPLIESGVARVELDWERGKELTLALLEMPPVVLGPLRLELTSLSASRTLLPDDVQYLLRMAGKAKLTLPRLDALELEVQSIGADWRERGPRSLSITDASLVLPDDVPLFGGSRFLVSVAASTAGPGEALGFTASLKLEDLSPLATSIADVEIDAPQGLLFKVAVPAGAQSPSIGISDGPLVVKLPLLDFQVVSATLSSESWKLSGSASPKEVLPYLNLGPATGDLEIGDGTFRASLLHGSIRMNLFARALAVDDVGLEFACDASGQRLEVQCRQLELGELLFGSTAAFGRLAVKNACVIVRRNEQGACSASIEAKIDWSDLPLLPSVGAGLPQLPESGEVDVLVDWMPSADGDGYDVTLRVEGKIEELEALWPFVPEPWRPRVEHAAFALAFRYVDDDASIELRIALDLRLPDLLGLPPSVRELIAVRTGNAAGVVRVSFDATVDLDGEARFAVQLHDALSVELSVPGMQAEEPALTFAITSLELAAQLAENQDISGAFVMQGTFTLRPPDPPPEIPLGPHLRKLLASTGLDVISGAGELTLAFKDDDAALQLEARLEDAHLEMDVFGVLEDLARGRAPAPGNAKEVPLSLEVGFGLQKVGFRIGPPLAELGQPRTSTTTLAALWMSLEFRLGELADGGPAEIAGEPPKLALLTLELSDRDLAIQIPMLRVALSMPLLPFEPEDLDGLAAAPDWDARRTKWSTVIERLDSDAGGAGLGDLTPYATTSEVELLTHADADPHDEKVRRIKQRVASRLRQRQALLSGIQAYWTDVTTDESRTLYLANCRAAVALIRQMTSPLHLEEPLYLEMVGLGFFFPFANPSAARLEGGLSLGIPGDHPLAEFVDKLDLGLGMSADQIFFKLGTQGVIALPEIGGYAGGSIEGRASIGYGYTRNSLAMSFNGNVVLPPKLVADADTSQRLGAGVRFPTHNRIGLRFDLIPVSIGPIDFAIPLFDFEIDLRAPYSPPFTDIERCLPYWDGFQVHVPGALHIALKHYAFNYFLGFIGAPNARFDFDVELGDERNGLRLIVNDVWDLVGAYVGSAFWFGMPLFVNPGTPYFDNVAASVRLAGFEVQFDLERPLPRFSPLALFEVLALLSDPMYPVAHDGHLANTVRFSLRHARIRLPRELQQLFPGSEVLEKPLDVTLNLGTLITLSQLAVKTLRPAASLIADALRPPAGLANPPSLQDCLAEIAAHPPQFDAAEWLALLPPELRKLRLRGTLGGFEAGVVILLLRRSEALEELGRRGEPVQLPQAQPLEVDCTQPIASETIAAFRPEIPGDDRRVFDASARAENLFDGLEFAGFETGDFDDLDGPARDRTEVVVGAHVTLLGTQRVRFLGWIADDGSFGMISRLDVDRLNLPVSGLAARLPLDFTGRLELTGRARRYATRARVTATATLYWDVLPTPGLAVLDVPSARLRLDSSGKFLVTGEGSLSLFRGALAVNGRAEISESHVFVEGNAAASLGEWRGKPLLKLSIDGPAAAEIGKGRARCRVGPGRELALSGRGTLALLGQRAAQASFELSERRIALETTLRSFEFVDEPSKAGALKPALWFDTVELALRGEIDLARPDAPGFALEGSADVALLADPSNPQRSALELTGRAGFRGALGPGAAWQWALWLEGELRWQGCRWARGRIELNSQGALMLSGETDFTVELSPPSPPFGPQLAKLVLQVRLAARFHLGTPRRAGATIDWQLASAELDGSVALALRLPDGGMGGNVEPQHQQVFPLVSQSIHGSLSPATGPRPFELTLLELRELTLLPFQPPATSISAPMFKLDPHATLASVHTGKARNDGADVADARWLDIYGVKFIFDPFPPAFVWDELRSDRTDLAIHPIVEDTARSLDLTPKKLANFALALAWTDAGLVLRYYQQRPEQSVLLSTSSLRDLLAPAANAPSPWSTP